MSIKDLRQYAKEFCILYPNLEDEIMSILEGAITSIKIGGNMYRRCTEAHNRMKELVKNQK